MGGSFSARVPRSSAEVRILFVHHILEDDVDGQWEQQGDQREDEEGEEVNGGVEEIRNSTHNEMTHARAMWDECELEPCRPLSQCSVTSRKYSQGTLALTTRNGSIHSVHEDVLVGFLMLQFILHVVVVGLVAVCAEFTCCQCTKLIHFLTCTGIPCRDSHFENGLVRCCLCTSQSLLPSLLWTLVMWSCGVRTLPALVSRW